MEIAGINVEIAKLIQQQRELLQLNSGAGPARAAASLAPGVNLAEIDIAGIQALKIEVDELGAAFARLGLSITEIQQARAGEALQLVNAEVVENQQLIEQQVTANFKAELDARVAAAQAARAFEFQQEQSLQQSLQTLRSGTVSAAIGALQAFAGQSKKAAIALVLINKARAIASVIQDSAAASVKALAVYGPTPPGFAAATAAKVYGAAQVALIAATGFGEIQSCSLTPRWAMGRRPEGRSG